MKRKEEVEEEPSASMVVLSESGTESRFRPVTTLTGGQGRNGGNERFRDGETEA